MRYTVARCPYGGYVWQVRLMGGRRPKSCPACKRRFMNPTSHSPSYATMELEMRELEFKHYMKLRNWLDAANQISAECKDMDDLIDRMAHR